MGFAAYELTSSMFQMNKNNNYTSNHQQNSNPILKTSQHQRPISYEQISRFLVHIDNRQQQQQHHNSSTKSTFNFKRLAAGPGTSSIIIAQNGLQADGDAAVPHHHHFGLDNDQDASSRQSIITVNFHDLLARIDPNWQFLIITIYSITLTFSLILNIFTILVLCCSARKRVLKACLINLSLSDLLASICSTVFYLSDFMYGHWIFQPWLCPAARLFSLMTISVSVATLMLIAIDRYMAIVRESQFLPWINRRLYLVILIWFFSFIISIPEGLLFEPVTSELGFVNCINSRDSIWFYSYTVFCYLVTFIGPLVVLIYLGFKMVQSLRTHNVPGNENLDWDTSMEVTRLRVTKGLAVVVISFTITWAPLQTLSLILFLFQSYFGHLPNSSWISSLWRGLYLTFHWLSVSYSVINPLIYCFMSAEFRNDLKILLFGRNLHYLHANNQHDRWVSNSCQRQSQRPQQQRSKTTREGDVNRTELTRLAGEAHKSLIIKHKTNSPTNTISSSPRQELNEKNEYSKMHEVDSNDNQHIPWIDGLNNTTQSTDNSSLGAIMMSTVSREPSGRMVMTSFVQVTSANHNHSMNEAAATELL